MSKKRTRQDPAERVVTGPAATRLLPLVTIVALAFVAAIAAAMPSLPPLDPNYTWEPSVLGPFDRICASGAPCGPSCQSQVPGSVCAEFVHNVTGDTSSTCCIPTFAVNTSDPSACIVTAQIDRNPAPED